LVNVLVNNDFGLSSIAPARAWKKEAKTMEQDIKFYKRIGSGSPLSLELTKGRRRGAKSKARKPKK